MTTYSPWLDQYLTDEENQFVLSYEMLPEKSPSEVGVAVDVALQDQASSD